MTQVLVLHGCCQWVDKIKLRMRNSKLTKLGEKAGINYHFIEARFDHPDGGKTWTSIP